MEGTVVDSSKTRIVSLGNLDHTILAYKNAQMASMRIQSVLLHKSGSEQLVGGFNPSDKY